MVFRLPFGEQTRGQQVPTLRWLEKRALEQVAALRGEHDGVAGHEKGRGYLKNRFSGSLKPVWHASETENLSG